MPRKNKSPKNLTINSQRFALFDSTFLFDSNQGQAHTTSQLPLHLRSASAEDVPTCRVCVCRRLPPAAAMAPGACLNSWLWGRVCAGEAREGLEGVLLRALARSIGQMLRCHELRVEARGPARPGPARLQRTPRSGAARGRSRGPASTMAPQDMAHAEQRAVEKWC